MMFWVYEFQVKLGTHILTSERVAVKVCQTAVFSFRICLSGSSKKVKSMELPWGDKFARLHTHTPFHNLIHSFRQDPLPDPWEREDCWSCRCRAGCTWGLRYILQAPPCCKELVIGCTCFIPEIPWYSEMAVGLDLKWLKSNDLQELHWTLSQLFRAFGGQLTAWRCIFWSSSGTRTLLDS